MNKNDFYNSLSNILSFKSISEDKKLVIDYFFDGDEVDKVKKSFIDDGLSIDRFASDYVFNCYLRENKYSLIAEWFQIVRPFNSKKFIEFSELMRKKGEFALLEKTYRNLVRKAKYEFFMALPYRKPPYNCYSESEQWKNVVIEIYDKFIALMENSGHAINIEELHQERTRFDKEELKEELKKPIPDKISEKEFWKIIKKYKCGSILEQCYDISNELKNYSASEIKKFYRIYCAKHKELYRNDVWALAFVSQGGCNEFKFESFKEGVILQGDEKLIGKVISLNPEIFPIIEQMEIPTETGYLESAIQNAHIARTGTVPKMLSKSVSSPKGREWEEEELGEIYPELIKYFGEP